MYFVIICQAKKSGEKFWRGHPDENRGIKGGGGGAIKKGAIIRHAP